MKYFRNKEKFEDYLSNIKSSTLVCIMSKFNSGHDVIIALAVAVPMYEREYWDTGASVHQVWQFHLLWSDPECVYMSDGGSLEYVVTDPLEVQKLIKWLNTKADLGDFAYEIPSNN